MNGKEVQSYERSFIKDYSSMLMEYKGREYDSDHFLNSLYVALTSNPKLVECIKTDNGLASFLQAAKKAARIGLSVAPDDGEAALIAYNGNVEYQLMTKGYRKILESTGKIESCFAGVVREDEIEDFTLEIRPEHPEGDLVRHKQKVFSTGEIVGAYAVIVTKSGKVYARAMGMKEIEEHRDCSKLYKSDKNKSPWTYAFKGMCRKTVMKDLLKNVNIPEIHNEQKLIDEDWMPPQEPRNITPKGTAPEDIGPAITEAANEPEIKPNQPEKKDLFKGK